MKKILITGAGSYIGTSFTAYAQERYAVDTVDMLDGGWRETSFSGYDAVLHVAGIVHVKATPDMEQMYFSVNRDLAIEVAKKAKAEGVGQFVFLSSMNIYGMRTGVITPETEPAPNSFYGLSKWQAEQGLMALEDESFAVTVLRPPMVYGKNCRGNFQTLRRLVEKSPVFPRLHNVRSLIHIDNLCAFVCKSVDETLSGVYFPQNREPMDTVEIARALAKAMKKRVWFSPLAGVGVWVLRLFVPTVQKAFGSLVYEGTEVFDFDYCVVDNDTSITRSL